MLEGLEKGNFGNLVTGDQSWLTFQFQRSAKWTVSLDNVAQKVRQLIGTSKFMLTVMWGVTAFKVLI
jgi:hypothetical protein